MKDKITISTFQLFERFPDQESARSYLESRLWPKGVKCPHCGEMKRIHFIKGQVAITIIAKHVKKDNFIMKRSLKILNRIVDKVLAYKPKKGKNDAKTERKNRKRPINPR